MVSIGVLVNATMLLTGIRTLVAAKFARPLPSQHETLAKNSVVTALIDPFEIDRKMVIQRIAIAIVALVDPDQNPRCDAKADMRVFVVLPALAFRYPAGNATVLVKSVDRKIGSALLGALVDVIVVDEPITGLADRLHPDISRLHGLIPDMELIGGRRVAVRSPFTLPASGPRVEDVAARTGATQPMTEDMLEVGGIVVVGKWQICDVGRVVNTSQNLAIDPTRIGLRKARLNKLRHQSRELAVPKHAPPPRDGFLFSAILLDDLREVLFKILLGELGRSWVIAVAIFGPTTGTGILSFLQRLRLSF